MSSPLPPDFIWREKPSANPTIDDLATAWLAYMERLYAGAPDDRSDPAFRELVSKRIEEDETHIWQVVSWLGEDHPALGLELVLAVLERDPEEFTVANLAAGPLEDLLGKHGEALIDRVEALAASDPRFRQCLAGVWQFLMSDEIWQRVWVAAGHAPPAPLDSDEDENPTPPPTP